MRQGLTVTGYVEPGPRSNKWYASVARARSQESVVSGQNGTFAIPGVPVTGGANALTVTVTDVSGNIATQVVNVTVISGQPVSIGYDANGNQTNHNEWAMAYDRENRLASASSASLAVHYRYDALGRLVERVAGHSTNRLYYAGWQLIAEYDGAGTLQRKYVYGPGIDEPLRMTAGGTNYYYHVDGLGSVTEVSDAAGNLIESYRYDVYGTPTFCNASGVATNASSIRNRLLFTGRDHDPDTGWYNYRHRHYHPALGRFVQPDPIGLAGKDVNLYRYVENNPLRWRDPSGLDHMNLLSKTDPEWKLVNDTWLPDDRYTITAHGNVGRLRDSNGNWIEPEQLANLIKIDPNYHGQLIELRSCHAGTKPSGGGKSYAERLSDALGGAKVSGPTRVLGGTLNTWNPFGSWNYTPDVPYSEWATYPRSR